MSYEIRRARGRLRDALLVLWTLTLTLWMPTVAHAATFGGVGEALATLTWPVALALLGISTTAGVTALAVRLERLLSVDAARLPHPILFGVSHMLGSWAAGLLACFVAMAMPALSGWHALALVFCASFAGARFVQAMSERVFGRVGLVAQPPAPPGNQIMGGQQP